MKEEINQILSDNFKEGDFETAQEQLLNLFINNGSYSAEDMSNAWSEGYHRKVDEINGNELRYFDIWLANYR